MFFAPRILLAILIPLGIAGAGWNAIAGHCESWSANARRTWPHKVPPGRPLGLLPADSHTQQADQDAADALKKLGVQIQANAKGQVQGINASKSEFSDADFARLATWGLQWIDLAETRITGTGLSHLGNSPQLKTLYLSKTKVGNEALKQVATMAGLETLALDHTSVSGDGLKLLEQLVRLRVLNLSGCAIDDADLTFLKTLTNLETLALSDTNIRGSGLVHLKPLKKLRVLNLNDTPLEDSALSHLTNLRELRILYIRRTRVGKDEATKLDDAISGLAIFRD